MVSSILTSGKSSRMYKKLVEEYNWTSLVYESTYSFQPLVGEPYYLYQNKDKSLFLSLISLSEIIS